MSWGHFGKLRFYVINAFNIQTNQSAMPCEMITGATSKYLII